MKNILVATDFSRASHNACLYGAALAKEFNARVILFSAYQQVPVPVVEAPVILTPEDMKERVNEQLHEVAGLINRGGVLLLETVCAEGLAAAGIMKAAEEYQADIIIAGMKNSGKGIRKLFGSTVTTLARKTILPLLVVPAEAEYVPVQAIALANESDIEQEGGTHSLDMLCEIGEKFSSRLYLVRVAKNAFHETYELHNRPLRLQQKLRALAPVYKCVEGDDIPQALTRFIGCYHIDMLALLPRQYSALERWFIKSTTRDMMFETHIPLLVLPGFSDGHA